MKVLGFGFAESDNSREIAMNRADVTVIYFGPRSENQICGKAFSGVSCEAIAGDQDRHFFLRNRVGLRTFQPSRDTAQPRFAGVRTIGSMRTAATVEMTSTFGAPTPRTTGPSACGAPTMVVAGA